MEKDADYGTVAKRKPPTSPQPLSLAASPRSGRDAPDPIRSRFGGDGDGGSSPERRCSSGPLAPPASRIPARDVEKRLWHESPGGGGRSTVISRHPLSQAASARSRHFDL